MSQENVEIVREVMALLGTTGTVRRVFDPDVYQASTVCDDSGAKGRRCGTPSRSHPSGSSRRGIGSL
jgi:hypothetical protein